MSANKALHRALGSVDIPAVARSMLIMGKDPKDESRRVVCHEKSSLAPNGDSVLFSIDYDKGGVSFEGFSKLRADDILNKLPESRERASEKFDEVAEALTEMLGDEGVCSYEDIETYTVMAGISKATLNRVKKKLLIQTVKVGYGKDMETYWLSPFVDVEQFKEAHKMSMQATS